MVVGQFSFEFYAVGFHIYVILLFWSLRFCSCCMYCLRYIKSCFCILFLFELIALISRWSFPSIHSILFFLLQRYGFYFNLGSRTIAMAYVIVYGITVVVDAVVGVTGRQFTPQHIANGDIKGGFSFLFVKRMIHLRQ